ncbi:MAG TPA: rhomboid family intramembrane serine protease [Solirubrobacteraceae bacterium]|nr:rhomboid family intramembrane serine protease [Solirubrobacteraceae bacterium]
MIPIKDNIPNDRFPLVTVALIVANIVVYVVAVAHGGSLISGPDAHQMAQYGATPNALTVRTAITSMFTQGSIIQLLGNMLFLWLFGANVEDSMGPARFLAFYLVGGLVALGLQVALAPHSATPTVGASGAIAAVIGGYLALYPRARMLTLVLIIFLFGVIEIPALVMLAVWLGMQAAFGNGLEVYLAHLGTLALGAATIRLVATRRKPTPPTAAAYR